MKTKRQKLALMMADMPHYEMADLAKIKEDYQMRFREPVSAAYIIKLYGTNKERAKDKSIPESILAKIKRLIFSIGSKKQLTRLINNVVI